MKTLPFENIKPIPFPLSSEQEGIYVSVMSGNSVSSDSCAGSGKSHTARAVAINYTGRVESIPFSRKLADTEKEIFAGYPHINSLNFHRRGLQMLGKVTVDNRKIDNIVAKMFEDTSDDPKLIEPVVELAYKLKSENFLVEEHVSATDIAMKYGFPGEAVEMAIAAVKLSDADTKTVDFTDMLRFPIIQRKSNVFSEDTLVVLDEVQDYTRLSWVFIRNCLTTPKSRVLMIGDPSRQCLMAFAGADSTIMGEMSDHYCCERHELTWNRRCSKAVVRNAPHAGNMKALPDAPEGVVGTRPLLAVIEEVGRGLYGNDAILSETNAPLVALGISLLSKGIPVQMRAERLESMIRSYMWSVHDVRQFPVGTITEALRKIEAGNKNDDQTAQTHNDLLNCIEVLEKYCLSKGITKPNFERGNGGKWIVTHPFMVALSTLLSSNRGITLLTGHVSKGLEWDTVFHLPSTSRAPINDWQVLQANCVSHVIATRARLNHFTLVVPDNSGSSLPALDEGVDYVDYDGCEDEF